MTEFLKGRAALLAAGAAATACLLVIAWELDWGDALHSAPPPPKPVQAQAVPLALLREFAPAQVGAFAETAERPLLVPNRRPSPPAAAPEAKQRMTRGQFVLMGTVLAGGRNFALLRESNGNKQTRVAQGDRIKGLLVDSVSAQQVVLRLDEETEVLALKTAVSARRTGAGPATAAAVEMAKQGLAPPAPPVSEAVAGPKPAAQPQPRPSSRRVVRTDGGNGAPAAPASASDGSSGGAKSEGAIQGGTWEATFERMRQGR